MSILSINYLVFAAAVFAAHWLTPAKGRWIVLLASSILFYALSGPRGLPYLLTLTAITYTAGLLLPGCRGHRTRAVLVLSLTAVLGGMVVLKYADAVLGRFFPGREPLFSLLQPLGLSWVTFQSAGYVIDVSRGKVKPQRNPLKYLLFLSFFPQMTQGPVSSYEQLSPQLLGERQPEPTEITMGFQLMLWGYFKKLVLADRLVPFTDYLLSDGQKPGYMVLLGAFVYMLRLYGDFSGGMDIIRGTAMTVGITMTENFRCPFFALSVGDYWRRWHISLGAWFRSYVYYPFTMSAFGAYLGRAGVRIFGRRIGRRLPGAVGTVLIFLLIGLWHGAHWNAVVYGLYFGLLMGTSMLLEDFFRKQRKKHDTAGKQFLTNGLRMVRTWLLLAVAQFFAFTDSPSRGLALLGSVFTGWRSGKPPFAEIMPGTEWVIALAAAAILLTVDVLCERKVPVNRRVAECPFVIRWILLLALIVSIAVFGCYGEGTGSAAFVYTQF